MNEVSTTPSASKMIASMKKNMSMSMSNKRDSGKMVITTAELEESDNNNDQDDEYVADTRTPTATTTTASHSFQQHVLMRNDCQVAHHYRRIREKRARCTLQQMNCLIKL